MSLQNVMAGRLFVCLAAFVAAPAARAQDGASSTQVYDRAYFEKYDTVTAEDMVRRVPGAGPILDQMNLAQQQQQQRGFGSAGDQILLNGKRFAGKNQILSALKRIQAATVVRIELIRGNTADANVQSEGLIVNIVLEEGAGTGSGSWQAAFRFNDDDVYDGDGQISYSDSAGALDYILSIQRSAWNRGYPYWRELTKIERYFHPNGVIREHRNDRAIYIQNQYTATANLTYNFQNGDTLRLNGSIEPREADSDSDIAVTRYDTAGTPILNALEIKRGHQGWQNQWEIGGDYEARLGDTTRLSALFIHSYKRAPNDEYRNLIDGGTVTELNRNIRVPVNTESILRSSLAWPLTASQTLELGGEAARNVLRQRLRPFFDLDRDGRVEEANIPTGNARVQEIRGEAFANHTWQATPEISLSTSMVVEMSRISNNFPGTPNHTYVYPKPRMDLRYDATPVDQFRFKVDRRVGQLDFELFVPRFDLVDNEIDEGNTAIRPEREWQFEAGYRRRLPNDQGQIEARAFYNHIEDHIDMLVLRTEPDGVRISAQGNIGNARHYGAEAKASVRMTVLGLPEMTLDARYLRQFADTTDPFLGGKRDVPFTQIGKEIWSHEFQVGLRHDVTAWGFNYGVNYHERAGDRHYSDIRVQRWTATGPRLDAFAEKTLGAGITLRVEGYGLMPQRTREFQRRTLYSDDVIQGTLLRTEDYVTYWDRMFVVSLRGTF